MEQLCTSTAPDVVLLVQHPPVFTLGAGSSERHLKFDASNPPLPLYQTERGGEVTFHGPGQVGKGTVVYARSCIFMLVIILFH